jgi:lipopolysaccharide transport system ATP-binding protein
MSAIVVSNLGKAYKQYGSRWARLAEWLLPFLGERHQLKWVLKDLTFSVQPGEALGIIGINGAGKSTLLKMITGTVLPTTGKVTISGKVAALLELGMGFHPDFTGRQNVYMAGQLLGYSTGEITGLMPDIESFAEIGDNIDQPVRVFSSGMQVRLAFSVATARRPDVLIIDEALSVGDAYFQHKSFERIREFRKLGTTLLIVSHDKSAIQAICDRAILLDDGDLAIEDSPEVVMDFYNAKISQSREAGLRQVEDSSGFIQTISGTGEACIIDATLLSQEFEPVEILHIGQLVTLRVEIKIFAEISELVLGYIIKDRLGQPIFGTNTHHLDIPMRSLSTGNSLKVDFSFKASLGEGVYSIALALHESDTHLSKNYEWKDRALMFQIINQGKPAFIGSCWIPVTVKVNYER